MMRATEHFQPAEPVLVGAQVVVATRTVPPPVARGAMVDFAVASFGDASLSFAEVLCSTLGG
jgi:flagellar basal body P-ring protein FlgI